MRFNSAAQERQPKRKIGSSITTLRLIFVKLLAPVGDLGLVAERPRGTVTVTWVDFCDSGISPNCNRSSEQKERTRKKHCLVPGLSTNCSKKRLSEGLLSRNIHKHFLSSFL